MSQNVFLNSSSFPSAAYNITDIPPEISIFIRYKYPLRLWCGINLTLLFVGGILSVSLLLAIIYSKRQLSGSSVLIAHVILVEVTMCFVFLPINTLITCVAPLYRVTQNDCIYIHFSMVFVTDAGFWGTAFVAISRLIATLFPHQYNAWTRAPYIIGALGICWALSAAINLPYCFGVGGIEDVVPPWFSCNIRPDSPAQYNMTQFLSIYVPIMIVGLCYFFIVLRVTLGDFSNQRVQPDVAAVGGAERAVKRNAAQLYKKRLRMTFVLLASSVWYVLCYFPYSIVVSLFFDVYVANPMMELWLRTVFCCGYAVNPLIFFANCADYRASLRNLCKKRAVHFEPSTVSQSEDASRAGKTDKSAPFWSRHMEAISSSAGK